MNDCIGKETNEEILKQNLRIIEGVASRFASVLYVNLENGSFTYHVVEKNRQEQYDKYGKEYKSFDEAFRAYAKDVIYENEQDTKRQDRSAHYPIPKRQISPSSL